MSRSKPRVHHPIAESAIIIVLTLISGSAGWAEPEYIVDTGPGTATGGLSLTESQYLAGQFTLDQAYQIIEMEGWMIYPTIIGDLPVFALLYGDDGDEPNLDDQIHRQLFTVDAALTPGWHGISGVTLSLDPGTYWLAFEVPTASMGSGAMPPTPFQELDYYAVDSGLGYVANETARLGIRVLPEARMATLLGLGCGFLALCAGRRRRCPALVARGAADYPRPVSL